MNVGAGMDHHPAHRGCGRCRDRAFFQQASAQSWTKLFPKMNWDPGRFLQLISYSNYPILHMCAPVPSIKQISEHLARTSRPPKRLGRKFHVQFHQARAIHRLSHGRSTSPSPLIIQLRTRLSTIVRRIKILITSQLPSRYCLPRPHGPQTPFHPSPEPRHPRHSLHSWALASRIGAHVGHRSHPACKNTTI